MATPVKEKNGTYSIRFGYTAPNGIYQRVSKSGFKTANKAIVWAEEERNKLKNSYAPTLRFHDLCDYFIKVKTNQIQAHTLNNYTYFINLIKKDIDNLLLKNITPMILQNALDQHLDKPGNYDYVKIVLSAIFNFAFQQELIDKNPFLRVTKKGRKKPIIKCYDTEQYKTLLELVKTHQPKYYPAIILMGSLGLRPSEAIAITRNDIKNNVLYINKAIVSIKEKELCKNITKTTAGIRRIPISNKISDELLWYQNNHNICSEFICCNELGERYTMNAVSEMLKKLEKKYNLPHITPYSLRHTFGNMNKRNGVDSYTVSKLMGHSDPSITEKNYYSDDALLNNIAMEKISDNLF